MKKTSEWDGFNRSTARPSALKMLEQDDEFHKVLTSLKPEPEWDSSIPHVTLVIEFSQRTATLRAWEDVPEPMMFYLLDCLQQRTGFERSQATRNSLREINQWIKEQLVRMQRENILWKEDGKWVFEG